MPSAWPIGIVAVFVDFFAAKALLYPTVSPGSIVWICEIIDFKTWEFFKCEVSF